MYYFRSICLSYAYKTWGFRCCSFLDGKAMPRPQNVGASDYEKNPTSFIEYLIVPVLGFEEHIETGI